MKQTLKRIIRNVKSINGNSLAEFATTTALMATLAATAAPKLSEMSEGTMAEKSKNEMDKILTQARNFYQTTSKVDGRGRFPGQEKYDVQVGGYGHTRDISVNAAAALINAVADQNILLADLAGGAGGSGTGSGETETVSAMHTFNHPDGANWCSVFGRDNPAAKQATGGSLAVDDAGTYVGADEWVELFAGNTLKSKYQDGHFAYAVIPGGGSGKSAFPPVLYVVDMENASDFNNVIEP